LPEEFGPWNSAYQRFARGSKACVRHRVFAELAEDGDFEEVFLDSAIVKAHQRAAGRSKKNGDQATGRSRCGLTTQIHSLVEGLGQLARWTLTGGQVHDLTHAQALIEGIPRAVIADRAFDADSLIARITDPNMGRSGRRSFRLQRRSAARRPGRCGAGFGRESGMPGCELARAPPRANGSGVRSSRVARTIASCAAGC
jgi:transposase